MLNALLKWGKKVLLLLLMAFLLTTNIGYTQSNDYIKWDVGNTIEVTQIQQRQYDVIIRAGEWANETTAKPGKRAYVNNQSINIPSDIPLRNDHDGKGFYISEADINKKIAIKTYNELKARGVNVGLQIASGKSEDLNAAARISNKSNPYLYLSLHHNSYQSNSTGYFLMCNENDKLGEEIANRLSNAISDNGQIRQMQNRKNVNNYIGELNHLNNTTVGVLAELGFFSNPSELEIICSDAYTDYVSQHLADEIVNILNDTFK